MQMMYPFLCIITCVFRYLDRKQYLDIFQVQYSQMCRQTPDQCLMPAVFSTVIRRYHDVKCL